MYLVWCVCVYRVNKGAYVLESPHKKNMIQDIEKIKNQFVFNRKHSKILIISLKKLNKKYVVE